MVHARTLRLRGRTAAASPSSAVSVVFMVTQQTIPMKIGLRSQTSTCHLRDSPGAFVRPREARGLARVHWYCRWQGCRWRHYCDITMK